MTTFEVWFGYGEWLLRSPLIDEQVPSPVTIAGTANVFEATVSIAVLDAQGIEIASGFTTARRRHPGRTAPMIR
jgi:hypothetical protein